MNETKPAQSGASAVAPRRTILRSTDMNPKALTKQRVGPANAIHASGSHAQASVRVDKVDGQVVSIVVTCACGQEIFLKCDYE